MNKAKGVTFLPKAGVQFGGRSPGYFENQIMDKHILKTIELIRNMDRFSTGFSLQFVRILNHIYPEGRIFRNSEKAVFEYRNKFYDIKGETKKDLDLSLEETPCLNSEKEVSEIIASIPREVLEKIDAMVKELSENPEILDVEYEENELVRKEIELVLYHESLRETIQNAEKIICVVDECSDELDSQCIVYIWPKNGVSPFTMKYEEYQKFKDDKKEAADSEKPNESGHMRARIVGEIGPKMYELIAKAIDYEKKTKDKAQLTKYDIEDIIKGKGTEFALIEILASEFLMNYYKIYRIFDENIEKYHVEYRDNFAFTHCFAKK